MSIYYILFYIITFLMSTDPCEIRKKLLLFKN